MASKSATIAITSIAVDWSAFARLKYQSAQLKRANGHTRVFEPEPPIKLFAVLRQPANCETRPRAHKLHTIKVTHANPPLPSLARFFVTFFRSLRQRARVYVGFVAH